MEPDNNKVTFARRYQNYVDIVLAEHQAVFNAQDMDGLINFVRAIKDAKRVFVVGAGREGIAARGFAMRIMHLGKKTYWLWDDTTPGMNEGDLFLAVDGSGKIGHIDYLVEQALHTGAKVGVITGAPGERIPSMADYVLFVPAAVYKGNDPRSVKSQQPMGNLFEQHIFMLFDIIAMILGEDMGLSFEMMERHHRNIE